MITVWGRATSSNVQIVMWALAEIGLECHRIDAGHSFGKVDTPEFRAMNPNGLVPVLIDGDAEPLWESATIVRYLGAKYGSGAFWPTDPFERARVDKWAEWIKTSFGPVFLTGVFWSLLQKPENRDAAAFTTAVEKLKPLARMLDARLADGPYLGGDEPCFADMIVGTLLYRYFTLDFDRADTPNLRAYYDRLVARPAYAEHVMVSYDALRAK
ncbi:glutathione S-transferase family protein [Neoaquamicrobium sediminum]|uniref:Glutathione S-transferase family protein n=1 Tax=Neoaquamicrobium sediminum TaxID=1849104 RepID=A0ABV3WS73_9HYPH|nr:glutathione S-transferase family protein [Mesorhizobium sediminum]NRC54342.1 glutathione S-transferase family protein [Mesorhizobium sediminum]